MSKIKIFAICLIVLGFVPYFGGLSNLLNWWGLGFASAFVGCVILWWTDTSRTIFTIGDDDDFSLIPKSGNSDDEDDDSGDDE